MMHTWQQDAQQAVSSFSVQKAWLGILQQGVHYKIFSKLFNKFDEIRRKKGQEGLFEGDGIHKPGAEFKSSRVYAGGPKSGKVKAPANGKASMSKRDKNKVRRGGKGANAFKSKAKHKRRN